MRAADPLLSAVIPVYDEEDVLPLLRERLEKVLGGLGVRWEVVFVDDGSRDGTVRLLSEMAAKDPRWRAVVLSRNYGHQVALTAGLDHARGDVLAVLDADLQDPPELIATMLEKWREGYDVVYGQRARRDGESALKLLTARVFYRLLRSLSGVDIPPDVGDFRLMDRKAVEALKRMPERSRFVRGMVAWCGFRQCPVVFDRPARAAGVTKYPWMKMARFAADAIFSFSVVPLRLATLAGLLVMAAGVLEILRTLYLRFVLGGIVPGFTSIFISVLFLGGLNLVVLGILGEYIGRIYVESKGRPLYFVQELLTGPEQPGRV